MTATRPPIVLAVVLIMCCAAAATASISKRWVETNSGDLRVGPSGVERCNADECEELPWQVFTNHGTGVDVPALALASLFGGVVVAALGGACALLVIRNRRELIKPASAAFTITAVVMAGFTLRALSGIRLGGGLDAGWAGFVALGSLVAGRITLTLIARRVGPDPEPPPASPSAGAVS
jgi:hypothetical protein